MKWNDTKGIVIVCYQLCILLLGNNDLAADKVESYKRSLEQINTKCWLFQSYYAMFNPKLSIEWMKMIYHPWWLGWERVVWCALSRHPGGSERPRRSRLAWGTGFPRCHCHRSCYLRHPRCWSQSPLQTSHCRQTHCVDRRHISYLEIAFKKTHDISTGHETTENHKSLVFIAWNFSCLNAISFVFALLSSFEFFSV